MMRREKRRLLRGNRESDARRGDNDMMCEICGRPESRRAIPIGVLTRGPKIGFRFSDGNLRFAVHEIW